MSCGHLGVLQTQQSGEDVVLVVLELVKISKQVQLYLVHDSQIISERCLKHEIGKTIFGFQLVYASYHVQVLLHVELAHLV